MDLRRLLASMRVRGGSLRGRRRVSLLMIRLLVALKNHPGSSNSVSLYRID